MEASRAMTREVLVVRPDLALEAAWRIMQRERIRHLVVMSGGVLLGILSDRDVLLRATLTDDGAVFVPSVAVSAAMTMRPITCGPEESIASIASTMIERRLDAMPVVAEGDALVGLVTSTDLLALLVERSPVHRLPFEFEVRDAQST